MIIRALRIGKRSYVDASGRPLGTDQRGKRIWLPSIAEVYKLFDETVVVGRDALGPIHPVTGFQVRQFGPERIDFTLGIGEESPQRFGDSGDVAFTRTVRPHTMLRTFSTSHERPIRRSLSDFATLYQLADNTGDIQAGSFTPPSGNIVIVAATLNAIGGGATGLSFTGAAGLGLTKIRPSADLATASGITTGLGNAWWGVGQGSAVADLVIVLGGATNARGTITIVTASGQDATPILQSKDANGDSTEATLTLDAGSQAASAIVTNLFRNDVPAITEDTNYSPLYEVDSAAGNNDHLNHVAFDRTSPDITPGHTWTGINQWDLIVTEVEEAAAAGVVGPLLHGRLANRGILQGRLIA